MARRQRAAMMLALGSAVLAVCAVVPASAAPAGAAVRVVAPAGRSPGRTSGSTGGVSDSTLASELVVRASDLPSAIAWSSQPTGPTAVKGSRQFLACMAGGGSATSVSPDPFGLTGRVGGTIRASVQAATFIQKQSNGEPNVTSSATVYRDASSVLHDLVAVGTPRFVLCLGNLDRSAGVQGKLVPLKVPRLGDGVGVGVRLTGVFPAFGKVYADAYFYAEQNVEIELSFTNGTSPFPTAWEQAIAAKVMERARVLMA
ncbi:MAG TPA: hypothetical protein VMD59_03990 [Acidimicrobiales bacterium]|nr:hypothetical protein [Acidimicrobiales bacterium]